MELVCKPARRARKVIVEGKPVARSPDELVHCFLAIEKGTPLIWAEGLIMCFLGSTPTLRVILRHRLLGKTWLSELCYAQLPTYTRYYNYKAEGEPAIKVPIIDMSNNSFWAQLARKLNSLKKNTMGAGYGLHSNP